MAYALIGSWTQSLGQNGGTGSARVTTGADLLIVIVHENGTDTPNAPTDSKGNTWYPRTVRKYVNDDAMATLFYAYNSAAKSGTGHTFTYSRANSYCAITVMAFSGSLTSADPYEGHEAGATGGASITSKALGSVTPGEDNCLLVSGCTWNNTYGGSLAASGMTVSSELDGSYAGAGAYVIQTTATALNTTWSWTTGRRFAGGITVFKQGVAASGTVPLFMNLYRQQRG